MARKKIKLEEEAISEILVADTDRVSGAEASDVEDDFEEEKEQKQKVSAEVKTQAAVSGQLPTWELSQERNTNIHPSVGPEKGVKKVRLYTSTKTARHCVLIFYTETIHQLVEQTNVYYQQHLWRTRLTLNANYLTLR